MDGKSIGRIWNWQCVNKWARNHLQMRKNIDYPFKDLVSYCCVFLDGPKRKLICTFFVVFLVCLTVCLMVALEGGDKIERVTLIA